jgi:hypothetical protein
MELCEIVSGGLWVSRFVISSCFLAFSVFVVLAWFLSFLTFIASRMYLYVHEPVGLVVLATSVVFASYLLAWLQALAFDLPLAL